MSIQDRLNRDPETVKLEAGESLVGTILELSTRESDYGVYPLLVIETDDGRELEWHAFHTVAQNELAKANPREGDKIGIRNLGSKTGKNGANYNGYRIVVERKTPAAPLAFTVTEDEVQTPVPVLDVSALRPPAVPTYDDEEAF